MTGNYLTMGYERRTLLLVVVKAIRSAGVQPRINQLRDGFPFFIGRIRKAQSEPLLRLVMDHHAAQRQPASPRQLDFQIDLLAQGRLARGRNEAPVNADIADARRLLGRRRSPADLDSEWHTLF